MHKQYSVLKADKGSESAALFLLDLYHEMLSSIYTNQEKSDPVYHEIIELLYDCTEHLSENEKEKICSEAEHIADSTVRYETLFLRSFIENLMSSRKEILAEIARLDDVLRKSKGPYAPHTSTGSAAQQRLELMRQLHMPEEEISAWVYENRRFIELRDYAIEIARKENEPEREEFLIKEGLLQNESHDFFRESYQEMLFAFYVRTNRKTALKNAVLEYFEKYQFQNKYYEMLRSVLTKEETKDLIMNDLSSSLDPVTVCSLWDEEKMYPELLETILSSKYFFLLDKYAQVLCAYDQETVIALYSDYLRSFILTAKYRSAYDELFSKLHFLASLPGGKEEVLNLIDQWRLQYSSRITLMKELDEFLRDI